MSFTRQWLALGGALLASGLYGLFAAPIPPAGFGLGKNVTISTSQYPVTLNGVGTGGGFGGTLEGYQTTFWCVDSQLVISLGTSYKANVVPLTGVNQGSWDSATRYEDVTGNHWASTFGVVNSVNMDTAEARYRMAAWLVSQYSNFPAGPSLNNSANKAIQSAIWRVMLNDTFPQDPDVPTLPVSAGAPSGYTDWIDAAKAYVSQHYNDPFFNNWAIVSGAVKSSNGNWVFDSNKKKQTFLVQVVPEPGFYGVLALGLAGLFLAIRKREGGASAAGAQGAPGKSGRGGA